MTVNDTEWKFLAEQTGMSAPFNDMYSHYLRDLGYTGTLQDMIAASGSGLTPSKGGGGGGTLPTFDTQPSVTGLRFVGQTLYGDPGTLSGTQPITLAFAWLRDGVAISGATSSSYLQVEADEGSVVEFRVTPSNSVGTGDSATTTGASPTGPAIVPVTLNPSDKAANMVLSGGNLIGTQNTTSGTAQGVRVTQTRAAAADPGQYFEFRSLAPIDDTGFSALGLGRAAASLTNAMGGSGGNSLGWCTTGEVYYNNSIAATVSAWAPLSGGQSDWNRVYFRDGLIWFAAGSGNWNNSGTANPETGTGGISLSGIATGNPNLYVMMSLVRNGESVEFNFGSQPFTYSIPSNGEALNGFVAPLEPVTYETMQAMVRDTSALGEGIPNGVPESYNWRLQGGVNMGHNDPSRSDYQSDALKRRGNGPANVRTGTAGDYTIEDWDYTIAWITLYKELGATISADVAIDILGLGTCILSKSTEKWSRIALSKYVEGWAYREDFGTLPGGGEDIEDPGFIEPPTTHRRLQLQDGRNFHGYSEWTAANDGPRSPIDPDDVGGVLIFIDVQLVSTSGDPIDLDTNKVLGSCGADYWWQKDNPYDGFETHDSVMTGSFRRIGSTSTRIYCSSMTLPELQANPPPQNLMVY